MKECSSIEEALRDVKDGATIMVGGFGLAGIPEKLLFGLYQKGLKDLTVIANNPGPDVWPGYSPEGFGFGLLLNRKQIRKIICSYIGEHKECQRLFLAGELVIDLVPQGTLAERMRAGGAGIPAFYTPAGVGTPYADGKEVRTIDGKEYLLEYGVTADFSLVKAWKADREGNLVFNKTSRNFNPMVATAGRTTIAEVEELVEVGGLDPNCVHTPGVFVQRLVKCDGYKKYVEQQI